MSKTFHISPFVSFAAMLCCFAQTICLATSLPVGPIDFYDNPAFDNHFRTDGVAEITRSNAVSQQDDVASYLRIATNKESVTGIAIFDETSTGALVPGKGGTTGNQKNNDLTDFTISADLRFNARTPLNVAGFFLRLDDSDENGYLATIELSRKSATVRLYKGAGITTVPNPDLEIFSEQVDLPSLLNTWYRFSVTVVGDTFRFDFNDKQIETTYTDTELSRTVGQVGIYLAAGSDGPTLMNNFQITDSESDE